MKKYEFKSKCPVLERVESHHIHGHDEDHATKEFKLKYPFRFIVSVEHVPHDEPSAS